MFTDAHGGHTALVGANPNSEGRYSRSLNRMFTEGTGHKLFASPHRDSDRVAFKLAKEWTAGVAEIRRRPAGREGGSPADARAAAALLAAVSPERAARRQPRADAGSRPTAPASNGWSTGSGTCWSRRRWSASSRRSRAATASRRRCCRCRWRWRRFTRCSSPRPAITWRSSILMLPFAGAGLVWVGEAVRDLARFTIDRQRRPRLPIEGVVAAVIIALLFIGWPRMLAAGARLRTQHRWAAAACTVAGAPRVCAFRRDAAGAGAGRLTDPWRVGRLRASPGAARRRRRDRPGLARRQVFRVDARRGAGLVARGRRGARCSSAGPKSSGRHGPQPAHQSRWWGRSRTPAVSYTSKSGWTEDLWSLRGTFRHFGCRRSKSTL